MNQLRNAEPLLSHPHLMSSFQQLKTSRDKRHIPAQRYARDVSTVVDESTAGEPTEDGADESESKPTNYAESSTSVGRREAFAGLEVKETSSRGRGLYAKGRYTAGKVVAGVEPLQAVPSTPNLSRVCSGCLLTNREIEIRTSRTVRLDACPRCRVLYYCSAACKQQDALDHSNECEILQNIQKEASTTPKAPDMPSEAIRALGRICLARKRSRQEDGKDPDWVRPSQRDRIFMYADTERWSSVVEMENHVDRMSESGGFEQIAGLTRQLGHYLAHSAPSDTPRQELFAFFGFEATAELLQLCSAFQVNSFALSLPDVSPIGVAISPQIALANHSCDPNAVVVFPDGGRGMTIVAIKDIQPGEEVLTSYIDVSLPFELRQAELSTTYRFKCECSLCERDLRIRAGSYDGTKVDMRAAIWHQDCKGKRKGKGSLPARWSEMEGAQTIRCDRCVTEFIVNPDQLRLPYERTVAILDADAKGRDPPDQAIFTLIPVLHNLMPPSSYPLLPLLRLQLLRVRPSSPAELSHLDKLYSIVVAASAAVYPTYHPVLAILHAEWGQILTQTFDGEPQNTVAGRLTKSVEILRKGYELCGKAFGPGGGLEGKKLADVLRGVEGELHLAKALSR